ncbi:hypothetical protein U703_12960 [Rhodobacter capsulatus YW1]|nr:hypothetical protein U703_12960 [Rhodobacter capsulatus YW1]
MIAATIGPRRLVQPTAAIFRVGRRLGWLIRVIMISPLLGFRPG